MKRVFLSLTVIIVVASLAAAGTYASFSDIETSEDNYLETAGIDLQLGDTIPDPPGWPPYTVLDEAYGDDPLGDSVEATWDYRWNPDYAGGMQPGDTLASRVYIRNVGGTVANSLEISCVNENFEGDTPGIIDKDTKMIIDALMYHNSPPFPSINLLEWLEEETGKNVTGEDVTLDDWESHPITIPNPLPDNLSACLDMALRFDPTAGDEYEGARTYMTLTFNLQ